MAPDSRSDCQYSSRQGAPGSCGENIKYAEKNRRALARGWVHYGGLHAKS